MHPNGLIYINAIIDFISYLRKCHPWELLQNVILVIATMSFAKEINESLENFPVNIPSQYFPLHYQAEVLTLLEQGCSEAQEFAAVVMVMFISL